MSRSLLKILLALLVVGLLPFAASLFIVDELIHNAVNVGLNPQVQEHLLNSAEAHRQLFEAEKEGHRLAADTVLADPRWPEALAAHDATLILAILGDFPELHPRLSRLSVRFDDGRSTVEHDVDRVAGATVARHERRALTEAQLVLTFEIPVRFVNELEALGETLDTFRALETLGDDLTTAMNRTYLYFAGGVVILSLIAGLLLTRRTTSRIARLSRAAEQVAAGDLNVRVSELGRDELAALARDFNRMVSGVRDSQERLTYLERVATWQEIARRLAHEIKNPLTPILLAVQQLDRKFDELKTTPQRFRPMLDDALEIVTEEVETLRKLTQEFSEFARLPRAQPAPMAPVAFLEDFARTNPQFTDVLSIEAVEEALPEVGIDSTLLRQVMVNLINNAQESVPQGETPEILVRVVPSQLKPGVYIEVCDNGSGVPESLAAQLFDPYFTTKDSGTGLGLPIVKKIVLDHGGSVTIEPRDGGGTVARIVLPAWEVGTSDDRSPSR